MTLWCWDEVNSVQDLRSRLGLNFYKRATELNRHRLTELWEKSQPSSLRHLAVIRDVTVDKKSRIYLYRSLSNFELAVKNGETSWHAVGGEHKPKELELDEWGFPELNANEFLSAQDFISSSSKEVNSAHEDGRLASDASLKNLNTTTFSQNNAQTQRKASAKHPRKRLFGSEESPAASLNPNRPWKRPRHLEDDIRTASNTIPADLELDASEAAGHTHSLSWPDQRPKRKRTFKDDNDVNVRVPNRKSQKQALSLGLHMNPFGRFRKRGSGRPPKNPILLAVVKLKRLNEFPWFEDGTARLVSPAESGTQAHQSVQENEAMSAGIPPEMQETIDEIWNVQDEADLQVENHIQNEHEILVTPGYETTQLDTERDRPQENLAARINSNLTQGTATPCSHDMDTAIAEQLPERRSSEDEHSVQQSGSLTTFQPSVENYFTALENNDATLGDPPTTHEGYNPLTSTAALEGENDIAPEHLHSFSTPESVLGVSENSNGIPLEHMNPAASEWRNSISLEDHDHAVSESSHAVASEVVENQDALIGHGQFGSSKYGWRSSQYRNLGHLNEERHGIILDIIEQAGGVYPGGKELWWAYGSRIRASKGDAGKCPDSTTVKRSVMSLANLGIIRIFTFHIDTFSHSKLVQKIVALSSVTEDDERVANLQREMRKSYPQSFFPEEVPIDPQWRYKAGQKSLSTHIQDGKWGDPRWMNLISTQDNGSVQETQPLNRSAWARWRDDILLEHEVTKIEERAREEMFPEEAEMHTRFKVSLPAENLTAAVEIGMTEPYPEQIVFSGSHAEERIPLTEPSMPKPSPLKSIAPKSFHRKRYNKEQREYVKIIRLFTHPLQSFHRPSGTFSTEYFSEGKKLPFSLSIDTGAPGRFDSEMPQDLSDLLARHSSHGDQSMRPYDVCAEFDRVQDWELENVELLTQGKELGQLRFINHLHISSSIRIEDVVNHSEILALDSTIPASSREQMFGEIEQVASWEMNYLSIFVSHQKLNEFRFINHRVNPSATPWPSLPSITSTSIQETEILSLTRPPLSISATRALKARKGFDGTSLPRKYRRLTDSRRESTRVSCENYPTAINRPSRSSPATQPSTRLIEKFQQQKRSTNDRFPFTELETQRFIVVVGATRILAGGIAKSINWVLVGRYLDHGLQELPLAAGWKMVNQNRKSKVQAFDNAFPDAYVDAYEAGLVPSVDFNDIFRTDWEEIFQWAMTSIPELKQYRRPLPTSMSLQKELSRKNFKLPDSKTELEIGFEKSWVLTPFGRTEFFKSRLNDSETRDLLAAFPFEVTSQSKYQPSSEEASVDKAKTFIRANLNTPAHRLNRKQAKKILSRLPDETVDVALQSLRSENAVHQQRSSLVRSSGHRYRMSHFLGKLMRESPFVGDAEHFQQAMRFKKAMDTAFNLDEATLVPSTASMAVSGSLADGETAVLLSLVAASHIDISLDFVENELSPENDDGLADLDPIQANKITKWGIEYKVSRTATLDQGRIQFPMYIRPTASYVSGLPPIENYSWAAPMTDDEAIEGWEDGVPVWQDLMGNPLENIWRILVVFIVYFLVFYPYSTTTNVTLAFGQTSAMQEWEVEVILKWLECRGVIKQASSESWMTTEWWWCIFGEEGWRLSSAV